MWKNILWLNQNTFESVLKLSISTFLAHLRESLILGLLPKKTRFSWQLAEKFRHCLGCRWIPWSWLLHFLSILNTFPSSLWACHHLNKLSALRSIDQECTHSNASQAGQPLTLVGTCGPPPAPSGPMRMLIACGHPSLGQHTPLPQPRFEIRHLQCYHASGVQPWEEAREYPGSRQALFVTEPWSPGSQRLIWKRNKGSGWTSPFGPAIFLALRVTE